MALVCLALFLPVIYIYYYFFFYTTGMRDKCLNLLLIVGELKTHACSGNPRQDTLRDFWMNQLDNNHHFGSEASREKHIYSQPDAGLFKEACKQAWVNESRSSLQPSQQKLDVPQWQAGAHWMVYIKKVCSLWESTKTGGDKLCSFFE